MYLCTIEQTKRVKNISLMNHDIWQLNPTNVILLKRCSKVDGCAKYVETLVKFSQQKPITKVPKITSSELCHLFAPLSLLYTCKSGSFEMASINIFISLFVYYSKLYVHYIRIVWPVIVITRDNDINLSTIPCLLLSICIISIAINREY